MFSFSNKNFQYIKYTDCESSFEGGFGNDSHLSDFESEGGLESGSEQELPELTPEELEAIKSAQKAADAEMKKLSEAGFGERLVRSEGIEPQGREEVAEALRKAIEVVREKGV